MRNHVASCLVVLGLLTSCRQTEPARAAAVPVGPSTPVASITAAARAVEATPAPRPASTESATELSLALTRGTWMSGSLARRAFSTAAPTHGGHDRLNRMADELRALAAECQCTRRPIQLAIEDAVPGWQLLSVLGLLKVAGFSQVQVEYHAESLRFELGSSATPSSKPTLRILGSSVFLAGTKAEASDAGLAVFCRASACAEAVLSVAEEAELDVWWRAAGMVAGTEHTRPVALVLDSQPRPTVKLEVAGPAIQPIANIALASIQKRVMTEYAALYICLAKFPLQIPTEPKAPLAFDLSIGADGVTTSVEIVGTPAPSEAIACLRSAFKAMVFHAPNFGSAKVRYPFARGER